MLKVDFIVGLIMPLTVNLTTVSEILRELANIWAKETKMHIKVVWYLYINSHKVAYGLTCKNGKDCTFYEKLVYETSENPA